MLFAGIITVCDCGLWGKRNIEGGGGNENFRRGRGLNRAQWDTVPTPRRWRGRRLPRKMGWERPCVAEHIPENAVQLFHAPLMKAPTILSALALLVALGSAVFDEVRMKRRIAAALNQPVTSPTASPANDATTATPAAAASAPELLAMREEWQRARGELAAAEQRATNFASRLGGLEQQLAQMSAAVAALHEVARTLRPGFPDPQNPRRRSWGPEQATGPADTPEAGDFPTAWASRLPDGGEEWLRLEFETPLSLAEVHVFESYNPGAIAKLTAFLLNGDEVPIWEGVEPEANAPVVRAFALPFVAQVTAVKIYLDTKRVAGWNEIDAVEVIGRDGTRQWAKSATASSTFAEP